MSQPETPGTAVVVADESGGGALAVPHATVGVGEEFHGHPTPRQYVLIAVILVVVTAVEIATSYLNTGHTNLVILALGLMAAVKFALVCAWYMHMRTDQPFFRRVFVTGIILASFVYAVLLLMLSSTTLKG